MIDVSKIRKDFPMYNKHNGLYNKLPLIYLDSAATSFKPSCVLDEIKNYYENYTSNTKRSDYILAYEVDKKFEEARKVVADFFNAGIDEISFTSGTTFSLNQIAYSLIDEIKKGDEIIISYNEHASNVLPWYNIAKLKEAKIVFVPLDKYGNITKDNLLKVINKKTKIVSFASVSNVLGNRINTKELSNIAHKYNAYYICDAAQEAPHHKIDVKDSDVDFLVCSAHKMLGPTGVGLMYVKKEIQHKLKPFLYGGEMNARFDINLNVSLKEFPLSFEAGTQNIEGVLGFAKAIKYLKRIGFDEIEKHEEELKKYAISKLKKLDNVILYNRNNDSGIITFNVKKVFAQDVASYLSSKNVFIRSGTHCAKLLHEHIKDNSTCRASTYIYNDFKDIDRFVDGVSKSEDFLDAFFG